VDRKTAHAIVDELPEEFTIAELIDALRRQEARSARLAPEAEVALPFGD
jgi:hypothetical protein